MMISLYFASTLAAAALSGAAAHKHGHEERNMASEGAELAKTWPHNRVGNGTSDSFSCEVTCNGNDMDVDLKAKSWPKTECLGSFVSKCLRKHEDRSVEVTTKCNGVFMFEKQAPADASDGFDAVRSVADAMLADEPAGLASDGDHSKKGFTFSGCEGELLAASVVSESDAANSASSASSSRRMQQHGHGGRHGHDGHGSAAMVAVCAGRSHAVASTTPGEGGNSDDDEHNFHMVFTCEHDLVLGTVHGLDEAARHGRANDVQHVLDEVLSHARQEAAHGAARPPAPPPPPPGSKESMDVDMALALQESAGMDWDAPSCTVSAEERPKKCDVTCNGHDGLAWFGLWPCTGELAFSHSASGTHKDSCFKDETSIKCFGRAWPFWKECDGTFLLDKSATMSKTKEDSKKDVHIKTFHVGVGKTKFIDVHHGPIKGRGVHAQGHTTIHAHAKSIRSETSLSEKQLPVAQQLHTEE